MRATNPSVPSRLPLLTMWPEPDLPDLALVEQFVRLPDTISPHSFFPSTLPPPSVEQSASLTFGASSNFIQSVTNPASKTAFFLPSSSSDSTKTDWTGHRPKESLRFLS